MASILDILKSKKIQPDLFNFEMMSMAAPWNYYLTPYDVNALHYIATSRTLAGDAQKRNEYIKQIMEARGFKRFAGGTNRVVYKYLEDPSFVVKIATDRVGMHDNPAEFEVQNKIKPFCTKMFQITPCGTVGFAERVLPIKNSEEFKIIAEDYFDMLYYNLLGRYVLEDIGSKYYMNIGVRAGFGPVLLDYPYVFELDGAKLICKKVLLDGTICNGEIDYDDGINELHCTRCGHKYDAVQLQKYKERNEIVIDKGGSIPMKVSIFKGTECIVQANESNIIQTPPKKKEIVYKSDSGIAPRITCGNKVVAGTKTTVGQALENAVNNEKEVDEHAEVSSDQRDTKNDTTSNTARKTSTKSTKSKLQKKPAKSKKTEQKDPEPSPEVVATNDENSNSDNQAEVVDESQDRMDPGEVTVTSTSTGSRRRTVSVDSKFIPDRNE